MATSAYLSSEVLVKRMARVVAAFAVMMVMTPLATAIAADETVVIADGLSPATLTVTPGTTVIWVNEDDTEHRVRSDDGPEKFDSGNLDPGQSFSFNFAIEGSYPYVDDRDKDNTAYHGTVVVAADPAPPPDPGDPPPDPGSPPPAPVSGDVTIIDRLFQPSAITVGVGGTITWANNDGEEHTVTANGGSFDSGIFDGGQTYSRTFDTAGTFSYFCIIHPDMTGNVTVTGGDGGAPPPSDPPPSDPPPPDPGDPAPPPPAPGAVNIVDFDFAPGSLTIAAGGTVTWNNVGAAPHTVTATSGAFDSGFLFASDSFARTFDAAGTYAYFCSLHPEMTATVVVTGADGSPPPPADPAPPPDAPSPAADPAPPPAAPGPGGISIVDNAFSPGSRSVSTGTTVTWTNNGAVPHTVTSSSGGFDSGLLFSGDTYRRTFTAPGTFDYICTIHPGMTGRITVTGEPTGDPPADESDAAGPVAIQVPDGGQAQQAGPSAVSIVDNAFRPSRISVPAGSNVSWGNNGNIPHTVTAPDGTFDSGFLMAGDRYSRRFDTPGSYAYICTIHPEMTGTVTVTEATGPIDTSQPVESVDAAGEPSAGGIGGEAAGPAAAAEGEVVVGRNVRVVDNAFEPASVTIEAGQAVRWANDGAIPHTVTSAAAGFDSGIVEPGGRYQQTFLGVGSYAYLCTLHPEMIGTIEVVAPAVQAAAASGVGGGASPPIDDTVAFILAGGIIASVAAMAFGMARFAEAAKDAR